MTILPVLQSPHPILTRQSVEVTEFNNDVVQLAQDLADTMIANNLVGIASNQIASLLRVIVINFGTQEKPMPITMVNPVVRHLNVAKKGVGKVWNWEGCGSIPNKMFLVERTVKIRVSFKNVHGNEVGLELEGDMAFRVQHEVDHLNGVNLNTVGKARQMKVVR